ncbi:MAG: hypothetical protein ACK5EU_17105 [Pseudanabaena sp.]|jgi:hypothetical protein|nr:hypothetical protein [Pseudanabaena mucicola]
MYFFNSANKNLIWDLQLIKVPTASTSLSQRWQKEVEAIQIP